MRERERLKDILTHCVLIAGSAIMILPFVWMFLTSLKPDSEILSANWIPSHLEWINYARAWTAAPFGRFYMNSVIVSVIACLGQIVTSLMAGYAFSRMKFFGKSFLFFAIMGAMMIPLQSIMIPLYLTLVGLHWTNTLTGLIVPMIPSSFGIFLFKQFFDGLPPELDEAAVMDGASRTRILFQVLLPLSKPAVAAFGILSFLFNWNNFFYPLIVVTSTNVLTLPLGLSVFSDGNITNYNLLMAATTIVIIPVLIVFMAVQKYFVQGVAMSGMK